MKKLKSRIKLTLLFSLLLLCAGQLKAQDYTLDDAAIDTLIDKSHDFTYKLQPLLIGEVRFSYEKVRAPQVSNEYGIGYVYKAYLKGDGGFLAFDGKNVKGVSIRMSQRHYTSKKNKAPFGFSHGPLFGYRFLVFEKDALREDDSSRNIGRLYQHALDLSYQAGRQFLVSNHITLEIAGSLGGRIKYAKATGAGELLDNNIIGHKFMEDNDSILSWVPLPQLKLAVGYSF
ncbi:ABC transporter ATP-binding protein [Pontibacter sp. MBLB2868]|uniref:ABC transporter ATP-binding protein n=1 Tax=Pontibacter sp. MBLB2868 TaxID=3451555 RepID=UPI003F74CCF4